MNKEFVTIEIAEKLKKLGFNEKCFVYFDEHNTLSTGSDMFHSKDYNSYGIRTMTSAPLYQQAVNWIYDNFKLIVGVETISLNKWKGYVCVSTMALEDVIEIKDTFSDDDRYKGLEQAINAALDFELETISKNS